MTDIKKAKICVINKTGKWNKGSVGNRQEFADKIIDLLQDRALENYKDKDIDEEGQSTVLAINATYGMGKTHFAKRLQKYIGDNAIYFSVWKKDYLENPLIAFAQEINFHDKIGVKQSFKDSVKKVVQSSQINVPGVSFDFNNLFPEKDPVDELKKELEALVTKKGHLVIIVDELDRCRPDYAVKTLETMKHFFDVQGISFIVPINKEFLQKSIDGFYNFQTIAGKEHYLDRFFDIIEDMPDFKLGDYISKKYNNENDIQNKDLVNSYTNKISFRQIDKFISILGKNCIHKMDIIVQIFYKIDEYHKILNEKRDELDDFYSQNQGLSDLEISKRFKLFSENGYSKLYNDLSNFLEESLLSDIVFLDRSVNAISKYKSKEELKDYKNNES